MKSSVVAVALGLILGIAAGAFASSQATTSSPPEPEARISVEKGQGINSASQAPILAGNTSQQRTDCKCLCEGATTYTETVTCVSQVDGKKFTRTGTCWKKKNSCDGSVCQTVCEAHINVCADRRGQCN